VPALPEAARLLSTAHGVPTLRTPDLRNKRQTAQTLTSRQDLTITSAAARPHPPQGQGVSRGPAVSPRYIGDAFPRAGRRVSALGADLRPTGRGHQAHINAQESTSRRLNECARHVRPYPRSQSATQSGKPVDPAQIRIGRCNANPGASGPMAASEAQAVLWRTGWPASRNAGYATGGNSAARANSSRAALRCSLAARARVTAASLEAEVISGQARA
jgi:hypothetical protein